MENFTPGYQEFLHPFETCDGLYHFTFSIDRFGIPLGACDFPPQGHVVNFGTFQFLPTGLHGLCFGFCFAGPLPLRSLAQSPLLRVRFGESLVFRLYSEIDHIHLSSEAQCVSHHLPPVDCHRTKWLLIK